MAATLKVDTLQNAGSATVNAYLDGNGNLSVGNSTSPSATSTGNINASGTVIMGSSFLRNRLINGDMGVYQRGSIAATTSGAYTLDRWFVTPTGATVTVTQSTTTIPTGFADSLNVAGAASVTNVSVRQRIESVNTQDLASGVIVTVSGRIYQSTGSAVTTATIALAAPTALDNYTSTTSAATTYTLPSIPNATWTTFSNTFTLTASCVNGLQVTIALGTGLTTGSFNFTGVQLEVGSVATPFERRQYGQELALCQRYYYRITSSVTNGSLGTGNNGSTTQANIFTQFPVNMRTAPTAVEQTGTAADYQVNSVVCSAVPVFSAVTDVWGALTTLTVASGLTAGQCVRGLTTSSGKYLGWSAEL
jgi:hypothetical protein